MAKLKALLAIFTLCFYSQSVQLCYANQVEEAGGQNGQTNNFSIGEGRAEFEVGLKYLEGKELVKSDEKAFEC